MSAVPLDQPHTDFLAWEQAQPERYELLNGVVRMMTGGSANHAELVGNLFPALKQGLAALPAGARRCRAVHDGVKLKLTDESYVYPDAMVLCGQDHPGSKTVVTNPTLVAEVLSPGTETSDRTTKFMAYQRLPSLRHILFVSSERVLVELFSRDEGETAWRHAGGWARFADTVPLPAIGVVLSLAAIYDGTDGLEELQPQSFAEVSAGQAG